MSGLSVSVADCVMIDEKGKLVEVAEKRVEEVQENFMQGLITEEERRRLSFEIWMEVTDDIAEKTWNNFNEHNAVKIMIDSGGTRASKDQVKQLAAMRGLVVDPLGKIVEMPTKSNFREGLSIFEYMTSSRGSRKGLTDSALKTADAGYLTRRLVDVAHDVIIREEECGTKRGVEVSVSDLRTAALEARIIGRTALRDIVEGKDKVLVKAGEIITDEDAKKIKNAGILSVWVRSPLTCELPYGMCSKCYGWDFSNKKPVEIGTPVGVVAAQSIGEPGTQLTMRVKHTGGIVGLDVTQGLPRVEELFEARIPKNVSPIAEISGKVSIEETDEGFVVKVTAGGKPPEERQYILPRLSKLAVGEGDLIQAGTQLAVGALDVKEVLQVSGMRASQRYLIDEIQKVYESQGIPINDLHFEVIIRKMSDKVRIEMSGDTVFLTGEIIPRTSFTKENDRVIAEGGEPAVAQVMMLGITRSSLFTDSWLSAASFMETTRVLAEAAAEGAVDELYGLKENVIIGRLIPTNAERARLEALE
jgi:DNA-directed RNA polymerase subunit beta'